MSFENIQLIDVSETHIKLSTDLANFNLKSYIIKIRKELKEYINLNPEFHLSLDKLNKSQNKNFPDIINLMYDSSNLCDVGPMATVAGSISELSLYYLINNGSKNSIVENGGDIAIINNKNIVCGIYSNNKILNNNIGFKLKKNRFPLGICTSSGKIGHSISFGYSDSVTVISKSSAISDGLATRIANCVVGNNSEDKISNALEVCENYKELFKGVLIISDDSVGTIGKLPKLVETKEFKLRRI